MYGKMLELKLLWESTSQKSSGDKISCAKKLDASMMLPSEHAFLNKTTNKVCCTDVIVID